MRKKVWSIFIIFIFLFSVLSLSLYRWQIAEGAKWTQIAQASRQFKQTIQAQRGIIKDRDGRILASNEIVWDIYVYKVNIPDLNSFVPKLADIVGTPEESYKDAMNNSNIQYFLIAKGTSGDVKDKVVTLDCQMNVPQKNRNWDCNNTELAQVHVAGINIVQGSKRVYPNGSLAAHVLGYVGLDDNGNQVGLDGVEGYYDKYLQGQTGTIEGTKDQSGNFILRNDLKTNAGADGTYLQLSLDVGIQKIVEERLKDRVESQHAKGGTVIAMDPSTGDILAFANYPTFDPNKYYQGEIIDCSEPRYQSYKTCEVKNGKTDPSWDALDQTQKDAILAQEKNIPGIFTNQGLSEVREPGSIIKVVTVSGAINEGKVSASTLVPDHPGCIMITDRKVCTADFVGAKNQTVENVIQISDNIGAYYIAKTIGPQTLYKYLQGFGIGKEVNVGLDGESIFPLTDPDTWSDIDLATASFGQGTVSTNSMENINEIATIANGGKRMQPHIIKRFVDGDKIKDFSPQVVATPVTSSTAKQMVDILVQATNQGYMGPPLKDVLKNYSIGGKTGTAQIPDGKGGYLPNTYNNTYIGFAPATNPKLIMLVTMRQPEGGYYAGFSAIPVWNDIAKEVLPYMGVNPDK